MTDLVKFKDLGLSDLMLAALEKKGFEEPTPIQAQTIPFLLQNNKDLIGKAQTGTGKTAAFGIPLIEGLQPNAKHVQAIILAPTRELAIQVTEELSSFCENRKVRIAAIYGGQPIDRQITQLRRGVDIVVGTPGRVIDHLDRKSLDISKISWLVLDEADEMLNMGFVEDIETIMKVSPAERRTVLFSATMPAHIERLAKNYMNDYETIATARDQINRDNIQQIYFEVSESDKFEALFRIIDTEEEFYGMVFCRTKNDVDEISHKLANRSCKAEGLHGDLSQAQREKILQKFRNKKISVLVATDVAARGIDVDNLTHVINHSIPQDPESYVHRIGRTGRAGKSGIAITLITPSEYRKLTMIQRIAKTTIAKQKLPEVSQIINNKKKRIKDSVNKIVGEDDLQNLKGLAQEILQSSDDATTTVAALLKLAFNNEFDEDSYHHISEPGARRNRENSYDDRGFLGEGRIGGQKRGYVDRKGTARLFIAKGHADNMDAKKLVNYIEEKCGIPQSKIDDVKVLDNFSFFATSFDDAEHVLNTFRKMANGGKSLVSKAKERESGGDDRPRGGDRFRGGDDRPRGNRSSFNRGDRFNRSDRGDRNDRSGRR